MSIRERGNLTNLVLINKDTLAMLSLLELPHKLLTDRPMDVPKVNGGTAMPLTRRRSNGVIRGTAMLEIHPNANPKKLRGHAKEIWSQVENLAKNGINRDSLTRQLRLSFPEIKPQSFPPLISSLILKFKVLKVKS